MTIMTILALAFIAPITLFALLEVLSYILVKLGLNK